MGNPSLSQARLKILQKCPLLEVTDEVRELAQAFLTKKVIPFKAATDAAHIAVAAVHSMDFLMTWNCKHIANAVMASGIEDVCKQMGYRCPRICTPEELLAS